MSKFKRLTLQTENYWWYHGRSFFIGFDSAYAQDTLCGFIVTAINVVCEEFRVLRRLRYASSASLSIINYFWDEENTTMLKLL
jgi:hypothetical protein